MNKPDFYIYWPVSDENIRAAMELCMWAADFHCRCEQAIKNPYDPKTDKEVVIRMSTEHWMEDLEIGATFSEFIKQIRIEADCNGRVQQ